VKKMMLKKLFLTCATAALLTGCSMAPAYKRPTPPVAGDWPQTAASQGGDQKTAEKPFDAKWQSFFVDPPLRSLITQALANNRDLRVAALNIKVAQATYRISVANMLPTVNAGGGFTKQQIPQALSTSIPQNKIVSQQYSANLGVTAFELDLFGRLTSLKNQALENYFATEEARTGTQISLVAEVANAYLTLLGDAKLLALTEDTLHAREKSLDLIKRSFQLGAVSGLDVAQAQSLSEAAKVNLEIYLRRVAQDKNALTLLVGAPIDDTLQATALPDLATTRFIEDPVVGLPSEVLLRRPDIAEAEHQLKAANANIGAARAAFFPRISLTGSEGFASPSLGTLFQGASRAWNFIAQATLPIFDSGRNIADLKSANAARDIAVARYEKAIQSAFRDVADALAAKGTLANQIKAQTAMLEATETTYRLSKARYDQGIDSYLTLLDSERSLYSAEQAEITVEVEKLSNQINLYKALGGGM
jgi:multidrug efflux system outer membrane protein